LATKAQLPDWASALFEPRRYKILRGGRGSAKSRSIATALVLQAARQPERILCCREVQRSIKDSAKRLLDDSIERLGLRSFFVSTETEIRGANGSLFIFAGLRGNAPQIRSIEGVTICWIEEAQTISQASLDALIPTIRAPGSEIWASYNPDLPTDPVDAMFGGGNVPPNALVLTVNYDMHPFFPDVLLTELEWDRAHNPDKFRHVWEGAYRANSDALVFKNWRIEDFDTPAGVEHRLGADFGFSIDPSVLVRCHIAGRQVFVDYEAYEVGTEIVNLPALFMQVPDSERWYMTADTSRPETISHLRNNGFPRIAAALKGARSLEEGVAFLQSYQIVVHPRCKHVIDELGTYSYKLDSLTGVPTPVLEDKNNHAIDALRYALEGARRAMAAKPNVVSVSVPSISAAWNR